MRTSYNSVERKEKLMKVLVSGGAGYIGSQLVTQLAQLKQVSQVVVYDNLIRKNYGLFFNPPHKALDNITFLQGDILDGRKLREALKDVDVVYHLAANVTTPFANMNPQFYEQVNHWGTAEMVSAVEESSVKRMIYLSSVSVYGLQEDWVDHTTKLVPNSYYGISKMRAEKELNRLPDTCRVYILRSGNVYGFSKPIRIDAVINRFMFEAQYHGRITIQGDGRQFRSFISLERVVNALVSVFDSQLPVGVYNLCDKNLSVLDLADQLKSIYPHLETQFANAHLSLRGIRVRKDERLQRLFYLSEKSLLDDLLAFKDSFAF
jgi:UDP-glucose 4-epimerase